MRAAGGAISEETESQTHLRGHLSTPVLSLVIFIFSYAYEYFACIYAVMCTMYVPGAGRSKKENIRCPGTTVSDGCGYWELNLWPLQEPSLQNSGCFQLKVIMPSGLTVNQRRYF